jgi:hypothetical protein
LAKPLHWRAFVDALPESEFPKVYRTGIVFDSRDDMIAGFEWFAEFGAGTLRNDMDAVDWSERANVVAMQWKHRKEDMAKAAVAREAKLAPLQAARARRAEEKAQERLKARKVTIANLQEDLAATSRLILTQLKPAYDDIDWEAMAQPVAHLSSIQTRLRFQIASARTRRQRKEAA